MSGVLAFLYSVGAVVCHQLPERSFYLAGAQFPVCARCTGLYVGGAFGIVACLVRGRARVPMRAARLLLFVASMPTVVTLATAQLGWWDPSNLVRAVLAAPLGLATGVVVTAGLRRDLR